MFDGKEDPIGWINRCEQFFEGQRTLEEEKVLLNIPVGGMMVVVMGNEEGVDDGLEGGLWG